MYGLFHKEYGPVED